MNAEALARDQVLGLVVPLAERFAAAGHRLYLVGGLVRDLELGLAVEALDIDCTTDARPDEILAIVEPWAHAVWTQGARFGTIGAHRDGRVYEITTHRSEVYLHDSRKPVVRFSDRLDDDLVRRDFTVNAMAIDPFDGTLIDPFDGRGDLARRVLRTPLEPDISFTEDPLRMIRAARFHAAHDLTPTSDLLASIGRLHDRLSIVSIERVRDELDKLLALPAASRGLVMLADLGVLGVVLPVSGSSPPLALIDGCEHRGARRLAILAHLLEPADPTRVARRLKHSNATTSDVRRIGRGIAALGAPGADWSAEALRRLVTTLAPTLGADLDDLFAAAAARWAHDPMSSVAVAAAAGQLRALAAVEDLTDLTPHLDGEDVKRLLGLSEGPEIGLALAHLVERRLRDGPATRADEERYLLEL